MNPFEAEVPAAGKLQLSISIPAEMMGEMLSFLDGRSLCAYETASTGCRQSVRNHPGLFLALLVRQVGNVPQMASLPKEEGKRALKTWDSGDFRPMAAQNSSPLPSPRYLHRVAAAADGWYYLCGGQHWLGLSPDVWRFRTREPRTRTARLRLRWQQVDGVPHDPPDLPESSDDEEEKMAESNESGGNNSSSSGDTNLDQGRGEAGGVGRESGAAVPEVVPLPPSSLGAAQNTAAASNENNAVNAQIPAAVEMQDGGNDGGGVGGANLFGIDTNGNPMRPQPRFAASWTNIAGSNEIYMYGGQGVNGDFLDDLWCFHAGGPDECRWECLRAIREVEPVAGGGQDEVDEVMGSIPTGRWGHTMVARDKSLYLYGGSSPGRAYMRLWRLDTSVRPCVWSLMKPEGDLPPPRGGHSATLVGDTLYMFGGNVINRVYNDLWAIDLPACDRWRQIQTTPDFPEGRIGHSASAIGHRIIIFGHFAAGIACFDTKLQCFVTFPRAEAFSPRAKLPGGMWTGTRVTGHAAVPCVRGLLFVGGLSADEDPTMRAWVLDVVTGRWRVGKGFSKSVAKRQTAGGCGIN